MHANSARDVPARVEALALAAGLGREAAHSQLAAALDVVLHVTRGRDGRRRLAQVALPVRDESGLVKMRVAVEVSADAVTEGPGLDNLLALLEQRTGA